jgi:uncharacterized protein
MPFEVAARGVAMALDLAPHERRVSFFGGEPLLEMDLVRRVVAHTREEAARREAPVSFLLVTNATLLTARRLGWFLEQGVALAASLDGDAPAHDATRRHADGRSSHAEVVAHLRPLLQARPRTRILAVIDPRNVEHLPASFEFLRSLGARTLSMNVNYEADWDEPARERFLLALRELGERYVQAWREGGGFALNLLDSKIVTHLKGGFSCRDRCDFGCEEIAVSPRGRLYPCDRLVGGDDRDDLVAAKNRPSEDCAACALRPRCMHWCGCVNHAMTGRVDEVSGLLCWFERRIIEEADRCAGILYSEGVPAFLERFFTPRWLAPSAP